MRRSPAMLLICLVLAWVPVSAATPKGPGPFSNVEIRDGQLVLDVKSNGGLRFTGSPRLFAAVGASWVPIDGNNSVQSDGARLVQQGAVNGVPIDVFFAEGEIRRILVRNGSGGETEIDLYRVQNGFLQAKVNRSPTRPVAAQSMAVVPDLAANRDQSITMTLSRPRSTGLDVVIAVFVPPVDDGINSQGVNIIARDTVTGATAFSEGAFATSGGTLYRHVTLAPGTYSLSILHKLEFGNPLVATGSMSFVHDVDAPITVSSSSRLFEFSIPHDSLPPQQNVALTVSGLDQLNPSIGAPLDVTFTMKSTDNMFSAEVHRDTLVASPLSVAIPLPDGEFVSSVLVSRPPLTPNSVGHYEQFGFPVFSRASAVDLALPQLVRVTGTILDPNFSLLSDDSGGPGAPPLHSVSARGATSDGLPFFGVGMVRGFARGFSFYAPKGTPATVGALFDVGVGRPVPDNDFSRNDSAKLQLSDVTGGPVTADRDIDIDVAVPAVAMPVTISGTVVDRSGRPVNLAFVIAHSAATGTPSAELFTYVGTGKDGRFTMRLPQGAHYTLTAFGQLPGF